MTLTIEQMPSHSHRVRFGQAGGYEAFTLQDDSRGWRDSGVEPSGGSQSHAHSFTGSSGNGNSLPPYYVLACIMRVA